MRTTRRTFPPAAVLALALRPCWPRCGSDDATTGADRPAPARLERRRRSEAAPQLPVTIEHKYGETTFTDGPSGSSSSASQEQDTLIALGIVPVGVTYWFGDEERHQPVGRGRPPSDAELPEVLDADQRHPVEKVAALAPDLIIGEYSAMTEDEYDLLSEIAPDRRPVGRRTPTTACRGTRWP